MRGAHIAGWDRRRANARIALRRGAITSIAPTLEDAIIKADLVILAAPLRAIEALIPRVLRIARSGALVLDVGPLKQRVVAIALKHLRVRPTSSGRDHRSRDHRSRDYRDGAAFVAGHPMAGRERSGPQAASADLFEGRPFALYAPEQPKRELARRKARAVVSAIGALPVWLEPHAHDRAVASTSALPQLAAIALALATQRTLGRRHHKLAGPGFESATRLADSPFHVWDTAMFGNAKNVRRALDALRRQLADLAALLARGRRTEMAKRFRAAATVRRRILATPHRRKGARHS